MSDSNSSLSVMVAHPSPQFRQMVKKVLMKIDPKIRCVEAPDGQDAINRAKAVAVDIAVIALDLPKLSGSFLINQMFQLDRVEPPKFFLALKNQATEGNGDAPALENLTIEADPIDEQKLTAYLSTHLDRCRTKTQKAGRTPGKIDVNFINPFIAATVQVLKITCETTATKEKVFIRSGDQISGDISAMVGMVGTHVKGSMGIAFKKHTFLKLVSQMLGQPSTEITSENQDACAEICNQVFGMAKIVLNESGYDIKPAIPSIVVGDNHRIRHIVDGICIAVEFSTEHGNFTVEAAVA